MGIGWGQGKIDASGLQVETDVLRVRKLSGKPIAPCRMPRCLRKAAGEVGEGKICDDVGDRGARAGHFARRCDA